MSLRGLKKNLRRGQEKLRQRVFKSEATVDEQYVELASRFNEIEALVQKSRDDVLKYAKQLQVLNDLQAAISTDCEDFFEPFTEIHTKARRYQTSCCTVAVATQDALQTLNTSVVQKLDAYVQEFLVMKEHMSDREKRTIDYDASRAAVDRIQESKDPDPEKVERAVKKMEQDQEVYERTNKQVKLELTEIIARRVVVLEEVFTLIVDAQRTFSEAMADAMSEINGERTRTIPAPLAHTKNREKIEEFKAMWEEQKKANRAFSVKLPDNRTLAVTFPGDTTVHQVVEHCASENPELNLDVSQVGLFLPLNYADYAPLDPAKTIVACKFNEGEVLELRGTPKNVTVVGDCGTFKDKIVVDLSWPEVRVRIRVCRKFGQRSWLHFALSNGTTQCVLEAARPLHDQGICEDAELALVRTAPITEESVEKKGGDVNIWDEPDDESSIQYVEGYDATTKSGELPPIENATLNKLVERLTHADAHDLTFVEIFLLTYESFTTPHELLVKICQRYNVPRRDGESYEMFRKRLSIIQLRVVNFLKAWISDCFADFSDELKADLKAWVSSVLAEDNLKAASQLYKALSSTARVTTAHASVNAPNPKLPKKAAPMLWDYDEEEIARQLTLLEFEAYAAVKPRELLNQSWAKEKYHHRAPNLLRLIERFNIISNWVQVSVLEAPTLKERSSRLNKLLKVAHFVLKFNNFSTLMAMVSGLNAAATNRLKHSWGMISSRSEAIKEEIESVMSASFSYKTYREQLSNVDPPCVPYIGVYLKDLTFIDDGNEDYIGDLINFGKRRMERDQIAKIKLYQNMPYNFVVVDKLRDFLQEVPMKTEKELYDMSLAVEPRGVEKADLP